ncbi:hypothetical protein Lalb_Chr08g0237311 [Lupinus albus]|uniref:Knottin, scorpion toxin n=1 Tax=Lupinus albus TaxID=3870 RepID=A0A6A4Q4T4_LUPAL|nr:hypothetical protein Lalb_Chr08g0237311 [Lupinus albus]
MAEAFVKKMTLFIVVTLLVWKIQPAECNALNYPLSPCSQPDCMDNCKRILRELYIIGFCANISSCICIYI